MESGGHVKLELGGQYHWKFATKIDVAKELKELFKKLEIPIILVTHNHVDAKFLAERLPIIIDGKIKQIGDVEMVLKNQKRHLSKDC